jgi:hypothetical protein
MGAQGAQGPTGAVGATGPAGPGALLVYDSTGQVVGSYVYNSFEVNVSAPAQEFVFIKSFATEFEIPFTQTQLGQDSILAYTSTDCSGTPYDLFNYGPGPARSVLTYALVGNTTAYVLGTTAVPLNFQSFVSIGPGIANGQCEPNSSTGSYLIPIVATYDLSTLNLVPPFSVK